MGKPFFYALLVLTLGACTSSLPPGHTEGKPKPTVAAGQFGAQIVWHKLKSHRDKIDFKLVLLNNTNEGVDLTKAFWKFTYNNLNGQIIDTDLDGVVVAPGSRRAGIVIVQFPGGIGAQQDLEIVIDNISNVKGTKLPPVKISGKLSYHKVIY